MYQPVDSVVDFDSDLWKDTKSAADQFMLNGNHYVAPINFTVGTLMMYDYAIIENVSLSSYQDQIDEYVIYEWNRSYPATLFFSSTWLSSFELVETMEFSGTSHEKITRRIYRKEPSYETER